MAPILESLRNGNTQKALHLNGNTQKALHLTPSPAKRRTRRSNASFALDCLNYCGLSPGNRVNLTKFEKRNIVDNSLITQKERPTVTTTKLKNNYQLPPSVSISKPTNIPNSESSHSKGSNFMSSVNDNDLLSETYSTKLQSLIDVNGEFCQYKDDNINENDMYMDSMELESSVRTSLNDSYSNFPPMLSFKVRIKSAKMVLEEIVAVNDNDQSNSDSESCTVSGKMFKGLEILS